MTKPQDEDRVAEIEAALKKGNIAPLLSLMKKYAEHAAASASHAALCEKNAIMAAENAQAAADSILDPLGH